MGQQEQQAITAAYIAAMARIRTSVAQVLTDLFSSPGSWREQDADRFVERALPVILGAQQAAATLTDDYLSRVIADETGEPYKPHQVNLDNVTGAAVRNGVDPAVVYRRPFQEVWSSLAEDNRRAEAIEQAEERAESTDDVLERLEREQAERRARRRREAEARPEPPARRDLPKPNEKPLTTAVERGERRARLISLTDVELTTTHTARERLAAEPRIRYFRRVLTGTESCGLCILASSQRYHKKDLLPIHPNCVPEGTWVRARNISGATRRWYAGKLTVLTTARGDQLAVTPNHPVLTDRGWVPAGGVREGDHLVRSGGGERVVGHGPNERERPVLAEDVWRSLTMSFGFVQVPLAAEDLHGDGADGEVDVVRADGYFSTVGHPQRPQLGLEGLFVGRRERRIELAGAGRTATLVPGRLPAADSGLSRSGLGGALFGGHLCGAHAAGVGSPPSRDPRLPQPALYDVPRDPMAVGEDVLGDAVVDVVDAELFSRVRHIDWVDFAGHVFNFQTRLGTYEADSHMLHNCDCVVMPILGDKDPGRLINSARLAEGAAPTGETLSGVPVYGDDDLIDLGFLNNEAHKAIIEEFGEMAHDARRLDYRKILIVSEHGEMGPILRVARHKFTKRQINERDLAARGRPSPRRPTRS